MALLDIKPLFDCVRFELGKAVIEAAGKDELDRLVAGMKEKPEVVVEVIGHTCDIGSAANNLALGQRRANAVKRYMVEQGINSNRITAVSVGENEPFLPNDSEGNRRLNRCVTLDANFPFEGALVTAE